MRWWLALLGVATAPALLDTACLNASRAACADCPGFAWCELCDACVRTAEAVKDEL
jgi:hypothetical protein